MEEQIQKAPARFTQHAKNPEKNVEIGGDNIAFIPCYGSPFVNCLDHGRRPGTLEDFRNFAKLACAIPHLNITGGMMMESNDIPVEIRNAERTYAAMTLSDKPFMGAGIMTYADAAMHYGTLSIGAPEMAVNTAAMAQMGRFYNLPSRGKESLTDTKTVDAQAGCESMMSLQMACLSGINFVLHSAGILDGYMTASYEKFMIDAEMMGMCRRIKKGEEIIPENWPWMSSTRWGPAASISPTATHFSISDPSSILP